LSKDAGPDRQVVVKDAVEIAGTAGLLSADHQTIAHERPHLDRAVGIGHQKLGRVDEDDRDFVLFGAGLNDRVILFRAEHPTRRTNQKFGSILAKAANDVGISPVGTDQDAHLSKGCVVDR
jgi:hypothetical protein